MIDNYWVLLYRTDFLTRLFKIFPFFVSDVFFIAIIAMGYWLNPARSLFRSLAFLVPFSGLMDSLLKCIFRIPRPDLSLHLIPVHDPFGFPSGDVLVSTVFWTMILLNVNNSLRYLCVLPIIGVIISRVYLGVHSVYDVMGGLVFGLSLVYAWQSYLNKWLIGIPFCPSYKKFWGLWGAIIFLGSLVSYGLDGATQSDYIKMVAPLIGALTGFGLSLKWMKNQVTDSHYKMPILAALAALVFITLLNRLMPVLETRTVLAYLTLALKYTVLIFVILVWVPAIHLKWVKYFKK